jgi:NAD(P)-dependent dehydrogenase (short-subunit alcohol dehydrogenase family)
MDAGQSLQHEVAPFGISTTIVNPGIFRTELLTTESVTYVESSLEDYADHTAEHLKSWDALNGQERPPRRFIAGTDGIGFAEQKVADLQQQIEAFRDLSTSLAHGAEAAAA